MKSITTERLKKLSTIMPYKGTGLVADPEQAQLVQPFDTLMTVVRCVVYVKCLKGLSTLDIVDIPVDEFNGLPEHEVEWLD